MKIDVVNDKISIIIPMFNAEKYIEENIKSLLGQTYKNIEIIIIDDGSSDNCCNFIEKKFNEELKEKKIILIHQNNFGAPSARNRGIENATGEYMVFLDSDDFLNNNAIELMWNKIKNDNSDIVVGNVDMVNEKGKFLKRKKIYFNEIQKNSLTYKMLIDPLPCGKMFKTNIIKKNNICFDNVKIGQDLNFFLKYMLFCNKISHLSEIIGNYRIVESSISRTYSIKILDIVNSLNLVEKFYKINNANNEYFKSLNIIKYQHFYSQLSKVIYYKKRYERVLIKKHLIDKIKSIKLDSNLLDEDEKKFIKKLKIKMKVKSSMLFYIYSKIKNWR